MWGMNRDDTLEYISTALSGIPEGFSGKLPEIPVGTGILPMPRYRLDHSKTVCEKRFFTPPFETAESLRRRLEETYCSAKVSTVQGIASFVCRKEEARSCGKKMEKCQIWG